VSFIESLGRDLRFGARTLLRSPLTTAAAVLSIGLGIGASTTVFGVVDAALYRPPPFADARRLVIVYEAHARAAAETELTRWSWRRFRALAAASRSLESIGSASRAVLAFTGDDPAPVNAEVVSSSYFRVLQVRPVVGTTFAASDDESTAQPTAILGYDAWRDRFSGETSVIGRSILVNGVSLTIIGVAPEGFRGITGEAELWIQPSVASVVSFAGYLSSDENFITVVGRLKDGVSLGEAGAELALIGRRIGATTPALRGSVGATVRSLNDARIDPSTRRPLHLLLAGAACLLLLACVNVAGLQLGLAAARRREIAIRAAIGATRRRLVRQLLIEGSLLAAGGGAIGVFVSIVAAGSVALPAAAHRGRNFYGAVGEFSMPSVDARVLAFSILACVATVFTFALVPALQCTRGDLTTPLKDGGRGGSVRGNTRIRRSIVAVETALALLLLVCGGLLVASWHRLDTADTGFDRANMLTFTLLPSEVKYPPSKAPALLDRVLEEIGRVPGVDAASVDGCTPVATGCANSTLYIVGRPWRSRDDAPPVLRHYIGPDHFRVLRTRLIAGRTFTLFDRGGSPRVAIINETAARRFWPDQNPIGQRVWFGGGSSFDRPDSSAEIVGIVGDVAYQPLDQHPVQADFYTPYAQFTYAHRTVLLRTRGDPMTIVPDVRRAVQRANGELPLFDVRAMDDRIADSWTRVSYQMRIVVAFAVAALAIAAIGVYAVIANVISDRSHEIGLRMALGASRSQVLRAVGAHGLRPAFAGLLLGLVGAIGVSRMLAAFLYGVGPFDATVLLLMTLLVGVVATAATYVSARRALAISPVDVLR